MGDIKRQRKKTGGDKFQTGMGLGDRRGERELTEVKDCGKHIWKHGTL